MRIVNTVPAGLGLMGALLAAASVQAQTTAPSGPPAASPAPAPAGSPPPAPSAAPSAPTTVQGVEVRAADPPMRSSIDRRSYSVEGDLQATTGSIADALKRIPSVEVDIDGNVKLRGDAGVTILIDGRPSALMKGQGRADALQTLPADQIERVEVLTNPGAQYSPEGTGGVINLVTKKSQRAGAGVSGSVRFNLGTGKRANGGINWAYNSRKLALSANAGFWRFGNEFESVDDRTLTGPGGVFRQRQANSAEAQGVGGHLRFAADYNVNETNRLSGEINAFGFRPEFESDYVSERFDGAGTSLGVRRGRGGTASESLSLGGSASWRREFAGDDHNLTLELSRSRWTSDDDSGFRIDVLSPVASSQFEETVGRSVVVDTDLKGDYNRPMPGDSRLKAGFEVQTSRIDTDTVFSVGPSAGSTVFDPARSHRLIFDETVWSGYLTYERPFGDLTVLAGLRFETATDDINLLTTGLVASHDYERLYPSLHLDYRLSDTARLKASYALRIRRPGAADLDPWRVYVDPYNYREGNPDLEPSETGSWEISYEYRKGPTYYLATGFWRETTNGVTDILVDLGGGVLLRTKANLGESRSGGVEVVANSRLSSTLSFNVTATALWNEIDAAALGFAGDRSGYSLSGRASLDWQATPRDLVQVNTTVTGRTLTPQGYYEPTFAVNLGYRRKVNDRWFLTVTATDVFDTLESRIVTDSPEVSGTSVRRSSSRGLFVGLRYRFGAAKPQREPTFDYGGGAAPGGPPN